MTNPNAAQPMILSFRGRVFMLEGTGGGCTAYVHRDSDGNETLITRKDTSDAPEFGEPATVSLFAVWRGVAPDGFTTITGIDFESSYDVPAFMPDTMTADEALHAAAGMVRALADAAEAARDDMRESDLRDLAGEIWQRTEEGQEDAASNAETCEGCSEPATVEYPLQTYAITFRDGRADSTARYCAACADIVHAGEGDNVASAVLA